MQVFIVIVDDDVPETALEQVREQIQEKYPDNRHYEMSSRVFFVTGKELTQAISEGIGIRGDNRFEGASGAVFRLNGAYSGFTDPSVWEWLKDAKELD